MGVVARSMTAYGKFCHVSSDFRIQVELRSINKRYLEVITQLPKELIALDPKVKNWVAEHFHRGQINLFISVTWMSVPPVKLVVNLPYVQALKKAWQEIYQELGVCSEAISVDILARDPDVLQKEIDMEVSESFILALKKTIEETIQMAIAMKKKEAKALLKDIFTRIDKINAYFSEVEKNAEKATLRYRQRLMERITHISEQSIDMDERVLKEVALFAEKIDITEEVIRFKTHIQKLDEILKSDEENVGKILDFVLQELNREINTIAAKASDMVIATEVIHIKSELEKIREQVQNIE